MPTKYIYLDDERPETVRSFIDAIKHHEDLEIELHSPKPYRKQISMLTQDDFDGLILDLRLDLRVDWENEDGERADYRATTLAQEIRTRATEGNFRECPLVLWSTDQRLKLSYNRDDTSHDLFDLKCVKSDFLDDNIASRVAHRLVSLSSGYKQIIEIRSSSRRSKFQFYKFLGFQEEPSFIDPRILSRFEHQEGPIPAHEYARFIVNDLLDPPGALINEEILAARLGIDVQASSDFPKLKERFLKVARYIGPFSDGWPRWWSYLLEEWWRGLESSVPPLRTISASERVSILKKVTKLKKLISAKPMMNGYSDRFWTICQVTKKPLDPKDGFTLQVPDFKLWQDKPYVSLEAALDGSMEEARLVIDRIDRERFNRARARISS
ncbi:MAG TPA: hypothetical protein VGX24_08865 [Pyrinomonadaceae bacterium]|jgi:hypothetical protein|nr:hypothetical protein [Pyrinomonadaceae bacterium]